MSDEIKTPESMAQGFITPATDEEQTIYDSDITNPYLMRKMTKQQEDTNYSIDIGVFGANSYRFKYVKIDDHNTSTTDARKASDEIP